MDVVVEKDGNNLSRAGFMVVFLGMLTQIVGHVSFPSYNVPLGFWAVYSSFSKNGRATFAFITFTTLSLILDIIYCSINRHDSHGFRFALVMFIVCMFAKVYALYACSNFWNSIGGSSSLEDNMNSSAYDALAGSADGAVGGGYYPPAINRGLATDAGVGKQQQNPANGRKPQAPFTGMNDSGAF